MPFRKLSKLHPIVADMARAFLKGCEAAGLEVIITQTLRKHLEQEAYYAQGRNTLDIVNMDRADAGLGPISAERNKIITWVKTSVHEFGLAFDVAIVRNGRASWDTKADINKNGDPDYDELGKIGEALGLRWGGRFTGRDLVHFEYTGGLTLADLKAGLRLPEKQEKTDMTISGVLGFMKLLPQVAAGLQVAHKIDGRGGDSKKPKWASRRVVGGALTVVSMLIAAITGVDIPADALNDVANAVTQLVAVVSDNWELVTGSWGAILTVIGIIFRKPKK